MNLFGRNFNRKFKSVIVLSLLLISVFGCSIPPVSAAGLTLKWVRNLGSYAKTCIGPLSADVNKDGKLEVVVTGGTTDGGNDGSVYVLDGATGNTVWFVDPAHNGSIYSGIGTHSPFDIVDLDKDGFPEIVVSAHNPLVLRGNNGSVYWKNTNVGTAANYNAFADVNNDGYPEIFVNSGNGPTLGYDYITCLSYDGRILNQTVCWHPCWGGLTIGDANFDGKFELYQGDRSSDYNPSGDPYKYGGWGLRALDAKNLTPLWNDSNILCSSHSPMLADVDKDGVLDVVAAWQSDGLVVLNSTDGSVLTTGGKYRKSASLSLPSHSQPTVYDVDNDGNPEIMVCSYSNPKIWDLYDWKLDATLPRTCNEPPKVGHVSSDNQMDIILVDGSAVYIYNSTYSEIDHITGLSAANSFTLVQDVDNDGYNELILSSQNGYVYCCDTPALASTPRVRSDLQFYSEYKCGAAEYVPPPGPLTPQISDPSPSDGAAKVSVSTSQLSFTLKDYQYDPMNYTVTTNPDVGTGTGTNVSNGRYSIPISGLHYGTTYSWTVTATDGQHLNTKTYTFTIEPPPAWWSPNWQHRRKITINATKIPSTQTSFPLLIDLTDSGLTGKAQLDGDDFVFTDISQTKLDHEIEKYDGATGHLIAWVRIPLLSSMQDTVLYLYYGNPAATNQQNPAAVWDTSHKMVQHLEETTGTCTDSTTNANNGTPYNGVAQGAQGKIDGATTLDGTNDYIEIPHSDNLAGYTQAFTASFWLKLEDVNRRQTILNKFNNAPQRAWFIEYSPTNGLGLFVSPDGTSYTEWHSPSYKLTANIWYYIVMVWQANTPPIFYLNANQIPSGTATTPQIYNNIGVPLVIGKSTYATGREVRGTIDEIRISNPARTQDWILTCYNIENNPTIIYTLAPEETFVAPQAPVLTNPSPADIAKGTDLNPTLTITATDYQNDLLTVIFRTNASGMWQDLGTYNGGNGVYAQTTTTMNNYNTAYWWSIHVSDGANWTNQTLNFTTKTLPTNWWNTNWQYRKTITINHNKVPATQTNFPVLIDLTDSGLTTKAQPDGDDFVFTDLSNQKFSHEIELYQSTTGHLVAWVKIPSLSSTVDTTIYMYYCNPSAVNQQNHTAVWDSNYLMVQHLEENSGNRNDSTANGYNLTSSGGVSKSPTGRIDGADTFDGISGSLRQSDLSLLGQNEIMQESWVYINSVPAVARFSKTHMYGRTLPAPLYWYGMWMGIPNVSPISNFVMTIRLYNPSGAGSITSYSYTVPQIDQWVHVAWGFSKLTNRTYFYVNGALVKSDDISSALASGFITPLDDSQVKGISLGSNILGQEQMKMSIDEARVSNLIRSTSWMQTSYNNQKDPSTFLTFGPEESLPSEPIVSDPNPANGATGVSKTLHELSFNLTDYQNDPLSYTVTTSPDIGSDSQAGVSNGRYTVSVNNLDYATTYTWTVNVTDGIHTTIQTFTFTAEPKPPEPPADDVIFNSNFDMGNLINVTYQGGAPGYRNYTAAVNYTTVSFADKHWWFYFSMDNVTGKTVTVRIVNGTTADYSTSLTAGNRWPEIEPVYSYDNVNWERLPLSGVTFNRTERSFTMNVTVPLEHSKIWLAPLPPYNIGKRDALFAEFASSPYLNVTSLGITPGGQELKVATITDPAYSNAGKFKSYVIAQQHAAEVPSSWEAEGLIRYLLSDDPTAVAIRRSYIFRIVPVVNVDGVYQGVCRYTPLRGGVQYDLNREWTKAVSSMQPEIRMIWQDLLVFKPNSFNDMHSTINTEVTSPKEALTYSWSTSDPTIIAFRAQIKLGGYPETVTGVTSYACTVVHNSAALGNIKESVSWENPHDELSTNPGVKLTVNDWMSWGAGWAKGNYLYFGEKPHYTLTVNIDGSGSGVKDPDQPAYANYTVVTLTATASLGWTFTGWSGDLAGSQNPVNITMNGNKTVTATFTQNVYVLTVDVVGSGSVNRNNTGPYHYGDVVELTAMPNIGWSFSYWSGDLGGGTNPTAITMDGNKTVAAVFSQDAYTLTITLDGDGSVLKNPDQATYSYGTEVQLTATANLGWTFTGWTGDLTGSLNPANITLNGNKNVVAHFTQDQYTLTINMNGNGYVTKLPDQLTYTYGTIVQLTANSDAGWSFSQWTGDLTETDNPTTINMTGNKSVIAWFTQDQYTLTVNIVGGGSVAKVPDQLTYTYGSEIQLTATANLGWEFSGWSGDLSGTENPINVTMNSNKVVTATFTQIQYTLTINIVGQGSVDKLPDQATYTYDTEVQLTAAADLGWTFAEWSVDTSGTDNPVNITITSNKSVTATFTRNVYTLTVTVSPEGSGSVNLNNTGPYHYGDVVELTAVSSTGWMFSHWTGDLSGGLNPTTIFIDGDKTIQAVFTQNEYTLTTVADGSGSVAKVPDQATYPYGTNVTLTAIGNSGWTFSHWTGDVSGSDNSVTINMTSNMSVTAHFTQDQYTLTINIVGAGSVGKNPNKTTYVYGEIITLTASADSGYTFNGWSDDLTGTQNPADINMTENKTVTATFTQDQYTLAINIDGYGSVSKNPDQLTYTYGTEVQLTATADLGWTFAGWSGDLTGSETPINITMNGNKIVTATFTQNEYTLSITIDGEGLVNANNTGPYHYGDVVELTAVPNAGWSFSQWTGDLSSTTNPSTITIDGNKAVTASFTQNLYTLTGNVVGSGSVTLNSSEPFTYGTAVELTAAANAGWAFSAWSGDLTGNDNPAIIIITDNKTVTATFTQEQYTLTINIVGNGSVGKNPDQATYTYGTEVTLTAVADSGWKFSGWSGDLSGSVNPSTINMTGNKTVTATFVLNQAPIITGYTPTVDYPCTNEGNQVTFNITATDPDGDSLSYEWYLDGTLSSTTDSYIFNAALDTSGAHNVTVQVKDGYGGQAKRVWFLTVNATLVMPFDTNATPVVDYAGYDNNGTVSGATWTANGKIGGAYSFDGVNDYIRIEDNVNLDGNGTWAQLTIEFWLKIGANQNGKRIMRKGPASGGYSYQIGFQTSGSSNRLYFDIWNPYLYEIEINTTTTTLSLNTWYHIVCVYKSGIGSKIYINGIDVKAVKVTTSPVGSETGFINATRGQPLFIGCRYGTQDFFTGMIDEFRLYGNLALTPEQINRTYYQTMNLISGLPQAFVQWIGAELAFTSTLYALPLMFCAFTLFRTKKRRKTKLFSPSFLLICINKGY